MIVLAAGGSISAGTLGLLVFLGLILACVLLFRSMNRRLRRLRANFPAPPTPPAPEDDERP